MANGIKAQKSNIFIAEIVIEAYKLPDGNYCLSQTQSAEAVNKPERSIRDFYRSKRGKSLLDKGYATASVAAESAAAGFVVAVPLEIVRAFWLKEAIAGNELAEALIAACLQETLERKCATAFNDAINEKVIAARAVAAYRETLFGGLSNSEYVELAVECHEELKALQFGIAR